MRKGDLWVISGDAITFTGLCQQTVVFDRRGTVPADAKNETTTVGVCGF